MAWSAWPACRRAGAGCRSTSAASIAGAVLSNDVVFGSVNANRAHYEAAAEALARADRAWLSRLITRRVPLTQWREAFEKHDNEVKVVIDFGKLTAET
jgi:threonine dehydrogenase-like Zn-dependent dehydrogenase